MMLICSYVLPFGCCGVAYYTFSVVVGNKHHEATLQIYDGLKLVNCVFSGGVVRNQVGNTEATLLLK